MTPERRFKKYRWLLPLSGLYGLAVELRNWLFDRGLLKQQSFSLPIINVGNITVGGTGKTPHVEYLVRLLSPLTQVAVLSRGYKRKTKGYRLATALSTASEVGDEPFQMSHKFPTVYVAVDADRPDGVHHLISDTPRPRRCACSPVSHSTSRRCATVSRTGSFKTMVSPSHCLHSMHRPNRQRCSPTGTYCLSQVSPHPR